MQSARKAFPNAQFGQGSGPIFLDEVQCTGSETSLLDCNHGDVGNNCDHMKDARVSCEPEITGKLS